MPALPSKLSWRWPNLGASRQTKADTDMLQVVPASGEAAAYPRNRRRAQAAQEFTGIDALCTKALVPDDGGEFDGASRASFGSLSDSDVKESNAMQSGLPDYDSGHCEHGGGECDAARSEMALPQCLPSAPAGKPMPGFEWFLKDASEESHDTQLKESQDMQPEISQSLGSQPTQVIDDQRPDGAQQVMDDQRPDGGRRLSSSAAAAEAELFARSLDSLPELATHNAGTLGSRTRTFLSRAARQVNGRVAGLVPQRRDSSGTNQFQDVGGRHGSAPLGLEVEGQPVRAVGRPRSQSADPSPSFAAASSQPVADRYANVDLAALRKRYQRQSTLPSERVSAATFSSDPLPLLEPRAVTLGSVDEFVLGSTFQSSGERERRRVGQPPRSPWQVYLDLARGNFLATKHEREEAKRRRRVN